MSCSRPAQKHILLQFLQLIEDSYWNWRVLRTNRLEIGDESEILPFAPDNTLCTCWKWILFQLYENDGFPLLNKHFYKLVMKSEKSAALISKIYIAFQEKLINRLQKDCCWSMYANNQYENSEHPVRSVCISMLECTILRKNVL